jgi:hypothetical protein
MRISRKLELVRHRGRHARKGELSRRRWLIWTLDGLEVLLAKTLSASRKKGQWIHPKVHLVRYADDFIITGSSHDLLVNEVLPLVEKFLRERGLELSAEKTHVTRIHRWIRFPRTTPPQVQGETVSNAFQKEHAGVSDEGPGSHRGEQIGNASQPDRSTQPHYSRMGQLSPALRCQSRVQPSGL